VKNRIRQVVFGAALAAMIMAGAAALHPASTFAAQFHCHNLNRIDYWVMTGIDSGSEKNVYCHGSM